MKYILKTNKLEHLLLLILPITCCLLLFFKIKFAQIVFTTLFQIFAIIGLYELKVKPIKFPDSDDNIISPVVNVWDSLFLYAMPFMVTLLIPNLSSAITFLISISIFSFVINQKCKWISGIITASLMILLPITSYEKDLLHFSFNINVNYSTIILLSVAVVLAGISIVIAKSKRLNFIKQESIALIILSSIKLITQAIVLPFFFERPFDNHLPECICVLMVSSFVFVKSLVCSAYPSAKLISKIIRKQYFSDVVDEFTFILQPKAMVLITATLTLQDRQEVKLYMFYIIEGDDDFKCPQKEWYIEESSYDNSKAAVFECFISNDEREIAKKILSSVKLLEEQNYENSFN